MKTYSIKWRRKGQWFWRTEKNLIGHRYDCYALQRFQPFEDIIVKFKRYDKLVMNYANGTMKEIPCFSEVEVFLTRSWYEFTQNEMNKEGGQKLAFAIP